MKKKAVEFPESHPSQLMKELNTANVPDEVAAHLPDLPNIKQALLRHRSKTLPSNPRTIEDLECIPRQFSVTANGEQFLLYDSHNDEEEELTCGRIIIFATDENLRRLFRCKLWSADGTFKSSPSIFYQLFTIMGALKYLHNDKEKTVFLPLVYALLERKLQETYSKVFEVLIREAQKLGILVVFPETVINDFEVAIIHAIYAHFGEMVLACFFHLRQSIYRHIQQEGLQVAYCDEFDDSIRNSAHMLCAIAFVPLEHVEQAFDLVAAVVLQRFSVITKYFEVNSQLSFLKHIALHFFSVQINYIRGQRARGRRRAVQARFPPKLWNLHSAIRNNSSTTNNNQEGWHNRFQTLIGKNHPTFYRFLTELISEQGNTDYNIREVELGHGIKRGPKKSQQRNNIRIRNIVMNFENYYQQNNLIGFLRAIALHVVL